MPDPCDPHGVAASLYRLDAVGLGDRASIGDIVEAFGGRSYGPFLLLPALIEISPIGGIPGLPTIIAASIILFATQILLGRKHIGLPQFAAGRGVSKDRLRRTTLKLRPLAERLDRWFHGRLEALRMTWTPTRMLRTGACDATGRKITGAARASSAKASVCGSPIPNRHRCRGNTARESPRPLPREQLLDFGFQLVLTVGLGEPRKPQPLA